MNVPWSSAGIPSSSAWALGSARMRRGASSSPPARPCGGSARRPGKACGIPSSGRWTRCTRCRWTTWRWNDARPRAHARELRRALVAAQVRWLLYMAAGLAGLCVSLYVLGMYLVGMGPRAWLGIFTEANPTPLMYDGKEPYEQWATK